MNSLVLKCKHKNGQCTVKNLTLQSTIGELLATLSEVTDIPNHQIGIKIGYPPTDLCLKNHRAKLGKLNIRSGDTLIVEGDPELKDTKDPPNDDSICDQHHSVVPGILMKRHVPSDNSCLFTSIYFVISGGDFRTDIPQELRQVVADRISSDKERYNSGFLGKNNSDYCKWILKPDSWGGGIELQVLSEYHNVEIVVVNTQHVRLDRFGEDKHYKQRVFLIYDGIHYDPLMLVAVDGIEEPQTVFSTEDKSVLQMALELAKEAEASHQYTDTKSFALKCYDCDQLIKGQEEANQHAQSTGHIHFGEVAP